MLTKIQSTTLGEIFLSKKVQKETREFKKYFESRLPGPMVKPNYSLEEIFASLFLSLKFDSIKMSDEVKIEVEKRKKGFTILIIENDQPIHEISCELSNLILNPGKRYEMYSAQITYTEDKGELIALMDQFIKSI